MSALHRLVRQTLTVARRDFTATVFTPTFLLFLLTPLIMIAFGSIGGYGAASLGQAAGGQTRIVALYDPAPGAVLRAVDQRLRQLLPHGGRTALRVIAPGADPAAQARAALDGRHGETGAVIYGPLDRPTILYGAGDEREASYLELVAEDAVRAGHSGGPGALVHATRSVVARTAPTASGHHEAAFFTVFGIFFLTLLLSGQAVGTMMEEKSNKVVEVLAAAAPLEAVFLGKLIGMFGSALLFLLFWGTLVSQVTRLLPHGAGALFADTGPAVGLPTFVLLFFAYFAMSYMLLGALFLSIGAQANTPRELQMLSLPITALQMGMFFLATQAASAPGSTIAWVAELFPLSSPYAMAAMAANSPVLWPHLLGLGYQLLWVAIAITIGAFAFRRGVLKSGGGRKGGVKRLVGDVLAGFSNVPLG